MCRWGWSHVLVSRFSLKHIKDGKHTHSYACCTLLPLHHPSPHPPPQSYELIKTLHFLKWPPKEALKDILNKCSRFNFDVCSPLNLTCKNTVWLLKCSCGDLIRWWTNRWWVTMTYSCRGSTIYGLLLLLLLLLPCQHINHWLYHNFYFILLNKQKTILIVSTFNFS